VISTHGMSDGSIRKC